MNALNWTRTLPATLLAIAGLAAMVGLSRVPWRNPAAEEAELRLSWRIPAPSERSCRPPTEADLEGVLPHMRPSEICTNEAIPFRLAVLLNGDTVRSGPATEAGGRARAITVYETFPIPSGRHRIVVDFAPTVAGSTEAARGMKLDAEVVAAPGDVIVVVPDESGQLATLGGS